MRLLGMSASREKCDQHEQDQAHGNANKVGAMWLDAVEIVEDSGYLGRDCSSSM
jgi:hypothetical protein